MKSFQTYPVDLQCLEAAAVAARRAIVEGDGRDPLGTQYSSGAAPAGVTAAAAAAGAEAASPAAGSAVAVAAGEPATAPRPPKVLPSNTVGLALSGGGIRSSTFCLGFLQAMARRGILRHVDILSTVSGGGYVGSFLGRFYDRLRPAPATAADVVEGAVANPSSAQVRWLREHGQYIAPAGKGDLILEFAIFIRNFLTLHFVLGLLGLGLYGLANAVRYGVAEPLASLFPYVVGFGWADMPIGHVVESAGLGIFWSPWFVIVELVLLLLAFPQMLGYWLASQDEPETFNRPALVVTFLLVLALLGVGVQKGLVIAPVIAALAALLALPAAEWAWHRVRAENAAVGTGGPRVEQLRARTHLSRDLAMWLAVTGVLLYLAIIDTAGHAIFEAYGRRNVPFARALGQLGAGLLALLPILRGAAQLIGEARSTSSPSTKRSASSSLLAMLSRPTISGIVAVVLMAPPLLVLSYVSHAFFGGGASVGRGLAVSGFALLLSFLIALPWAITLINRSSLQSTFAARIARAFLGATNPNRAGVVNDEVQPGDDVDVLTAYRPFEAGGPLHLINVCVNQTVDQDTLRGGRSRGGTAMACSPLGVSVGKYFHAKWNPAYSPRPIAKRTRTSSAQASADRPSPLQALAHVPGTPHPLLGADEKPPDDVELLPLRDWIAISGAAVGPGMGKSTSAALSILFLLANVRVGYWWDSGLTAGDRGTRPRVSFVRRLMWLLPRLFATQSQLLAEATAAFRGPWDRFWYLSDGGHFENLGGYELVRRRVPLIILLDGDADPDYAFSDFANFQRKVRIDFRAEVEPFGEGDWEEAVDAAIQQTVDASSRGTPGEVAEGAKEIWKAIRAQVAVATGQGGPLDELVAQSDSGRLGVVLKRHAALYKVNYPDGAHSLLLYVKASLTGDEPTDVEQYHVEHPTFPHEATADQFFDESQWESYRRLGEHVGDSVLGPLPPGAATSRDALWLNRLR